MHHYDVRALSHVRLPKKSHNTKWNLINVLRNINIY